MTPREQSDLPGISTAESGRFSTPPNPFPEPADSETLDLPTALADPTAQEAKRRIKLALLTTNRKLN